MKSAVRRPLFPVRALAIVCAAWIGEAVQAHHGGGVEWNRDTHGPIPGTVTGFAFRSPHVQVYRDVTDADGNVEYWALVTRGTPAILRNWGWTRHSIEPGDELAVTYASHVRRERMGNMLSVEVNGQPLPLSGE